MSGSEDETNDNNNNVVIPTQYESHHAREIRLRRDATAKEYQEKRDKLEQDKKTELESFTEEREKQDKDIEAWKKDYEKNAKKLAKKADKLAELEAQNEAKLKEYDELLTQRNDQDNEIESKFAKMLDELNDEEANLPVEQEIDDGHGYLTLNIEKKSIEKWNYPLTINIGITSNAAQFSDLTKLPCIGLLYLCVVGCDTLCLRFTFSSFFCGFCCITAPIVKELEPNIICNTSDQGVKMILAGIDAESLVEPVKFSVVSPVCKHLRICS